MYPVPGIHGNKIAMRLLCAVLFITPSTQAQCIASGPNSPSSSSSVSFPGSDYSFSNPSNCLTSNDSRATAASILSLLSGQTAYLQATDFSFSIPTASTICGIEVHVEKSATNLLLNFTTVKDNSVLLIKNGTRTVTNLKQTNVVWSEDNDAIYTYGDNNELWGTSWTPADINSGNFGFAISATITGIVGLLPAARIDHISMTVYYLDPSLLPAQSIQFHVTNGSNNSAVLSWKQSGIGENASLIVERSVNGTKWETASGAVQKSPGTSLYVFTDANPFLNKSLYRLKMIAPSGEVRYSTVQPFELTANTSLKCYPNPFTSYIQVAGVMAGERVTITNLVGQQLYVSAPAVKSTVNIDINDLQPGIYVISAGNRKMKVQKK
jgi:hypothetical protein